MDDGVEHRVGEPSCASRPVKVFCWPTWKEPSMVTAPRRCGRRAVGAVAEPVPRPGHLPAGATGAPPPATHTKAPIASTTRSRQQRDLAVDPRCPGVPLRRRGRCPAGRTAPLKRCGRRSAAARRRRRLLVGWLARPARCGAAKIQFPRPVAGEHAGGGVGAVGRRRQAQHEDAGRGVPKAGSACPSRARRRRRSVAWTPPPRAR